MTEPLQSYKYDVPVALHLYREHKGHRGELHLPLMNHPPQETVAHATSTPFLADSSKQAESNLLPWRHLSHC